MKVYFIIAMDSWGNTFECPEFHTYVWHDVMFDFLSVYNVGDLVFFKAVEI